MKTLILLPLLFCIACATNAHPEGHDRYVQKIESSSAGDKQFAGLYHNFEFRSTFLNRDISKTLHDRMSQVYAWSEQESSEKLNKRMNHLNSKSRFWLSFFTPERVNDNLTTKKSIWKVYLVAGGQRYEGKVSKTNMNLSEAKAFIPYHTRWATPYYIDFPVASADIEDSDIELIITGPLGRRQVRFPSSQTL